MKMGITGTGARDTDIDTDRRMRAWVYAVRMYEVAVYVNTKDANAIFF